MKAIKKENKCKRLNNRGNKDESRNKEKVKFKEDYVKKNKRAS